MKNKFFTLVILSFFVVPFLSCEGPRGPQGPTGPRGINIEAEVFEREHVSFIVTNNYTVQFALPFEIFNDDVLLVYHLRPVEVVGRDTWKLLPLITTTTNPSNGVWQYNYSFRTDSFSIFLEANFDLALLPEANRIDQTFRIVIVPGLFVKDVNFSDYDATMSMLQVNNNQVRLIDIKN